ncbi:MAG: hypothetical protein LBU09_04025 [Endomicrobium sp.]|jgi:hypothetical protein|nr:hypothetical protein [Endomicrobium sp.]
MPKILSVCIGLAFLSSFAFCKDLPKNAYEGFEGKVKKFYGGLFLTPEQKEALDILTERFKDKRKRLKAKISEKKAQKTKALSKKDFDKAKAAVSEISYYEVEIENDKIEYMKSAAVILSDEEYDRLNEIIIDEALEKQKNSKKGKKSR